MKLRIKGNSIRLRLSKSEVEKFSNSGRVSDEICFGVSSSSDKLTYSLETSQSEKVYAMLLDYKITLFVPHRIAKNWVETDEVGFQTEQTVSENSVLSILVEKDLRSV